MFNPFCHKKTVQTVLNDVIGSANVDVTTVRSSEKSIRLHDQIQLLLPDAVNWEATVIAFVTKRLPVAFRKSRNARLRSKADLKDLPVDKSPFKDVIEASDEVYGDYTTSGVLYCDIEKPPQSRPRK